MTCIPRILGVLNVTPDSFSDGGMFRDTGGAVAHGLALAEAGADYVDVGGQATGPGAALVTADEELARIEPVVTLLVRAGVAVSVDTFRPPVMLAVLRQGATMINDVTGFRDPEARAVVADSDAKLVVMHSTSAEPRAQPAPVAAESIVDRIVAFFEERLEALTAAGISRERIILDPGLGLFLGSNADASVAVLRNLPRIRRLGPPVCIAASRKSFLGALLDGPDAPRPVTGRAAATLACELFAAEQGAAYLRTHDVAALRDALRIRTLLT